MVEDRTPREDCLYFQYHVLCLVDLLSQRNYLAGWSTLPTDGRPTPELIQALKKTVGSIEGIKKAFREFFAPIEAYSTPRYLFTPEQAAKHQRFRECDLHTQQFSDTVIFYSSIMNSHGDYSIEAIYRTLTACAMILTYSLAVKTPLRGAVCIGAGTELEPNNFYGPAIVHAHHVESEVAGYPRIVVDKEVVKFLGAGQGFSDDPQINAISVEMAKTCRSLITSDTDGNMIVDFLGAGMFQVNHGTTSEWLETIKAARDFVAAERARFAAHGNEKLASRYAQLDAYIMSRLAIWGL